MVNGVPNFMAGVNWVPIRPDYADVTPEQYRTRLEAYVGMGVTMLVLWGGGNELVEPSGIVPLFGDHPAIVAARTVLE